MTINRLLLKVKTWSFMGNGYKRAEWARKKGLFAEIGENVKLPVRIPLYPKLVKIHNNVVIHRSVKMVTHDFMNKFLMKIPGAYPYKHLEILTPIEIMDNVYIGMNTVIFGNVRIGPNAIIQAGSLVINDVPPNSVVAGVPARVVGRMDMLMKTRALMDKSINYGFERSGKETIDDAAIENAWALFDKKKNRVRNHTESVQKG